MENYNSKFAALQVFLTVPVQKRSYLLTFILILIFSPSEALHAQYDSICCAPYKDQAKYLMHYYYKLYGMEDTSASLSKIRDIQDYAFTTNNKQLAVESQLMEGYIRAFRVPEQKEKALNILHHVKIKAGKEGYKHILTRCLSSLSLYYGKYLKEYDQHFACNEELNTLLETATDDEIPDKEIYYIEIANSYFRFREYMRTIGYLKKTILPEGTAAASIQSVWDAYNTIGLCYRELNTFDSSDYYFNKAKSLTPVNPGVYHDKIRYAMAAGNLGINKYLQKDYETAIPMLELGIAEPVKRYDISNMIASLLPLADIMIHNNRLEKAGNMLDSAYFFILQYKLSDRLHAFYRVKARWYQEKEMKQQAAQYWDSALITQRQYDSTYSNLKLALASQRLETAKYQSELMRSKAALRDRNYFAVLLILLSVSGFLFYLNRRKMFKNRQEIKKLELLQSKQELELARFRLNEYTQNLISKNKVIEDLQKKIRQEEEWERIDGLKSGTLLTEEDWDRFKENFDKVHKGFFTRMHEKYPRLTFSEQRFLALSRLKLSHREMALMLGVSQEALRMAHYRLRKKLGMEDIKDLETLVNNI